MEERLSVFEQFIVLAKEIPAPTLFWSFVVLASAGLALAALYEEARMADARTATDSDEIPSRPRP